LQVRLRPVSRAAWIAAVLSVTPVGSTPAKLSSDAVAPLAATLAPGEIEVWESAAPDTAMSAKTKAAIEGPGCIIGKSAVS
jgi:hypothetical protein